MEQTHQQHFLMVTYPGQGHINPTIHLATRLVAATGARITFSTSISAHRKMFPDLHSPDQEVVDGHIAYVPFSDGYDEGFDLGRGDITAFLSQLKTLGSRSLSAVIDGINSHGRPVDYVIYNFFMPWVADVARGKGIPSAPYWIQPATVFAIYYHYFRGGCKSLATAHCNDPLSTVELPGMPPLRIRDLPSFLTTDAASFPAVLGNIRDLFLALDKKREQSKQKPKVLVNTFEELEAEAFSAVGDVELIAVGPILQSFPKDNAKARPGFDLFKPDERAYMEWLDSKPEKSVVYVSFGSLTVLKEQQMREILKGLKASGRAYLWVVRKDNRIEGVELEEKGDDEALVVEWCSQVRVLNHPSVGCFVTHCGWNSTLESLVCGVPIVGVPQWADQGTNAMLAERVWGTGVRAEANQDGILNGEDLKRCLDLVLGEGERGVEIRRNAGVWKEKAIEAVSKGGSSDRNLRACLDVRNPSEVRKWGSIIARFPIYPNTGKGK